MSDGGKSLIVSGDTLQADVRGIELVIFITLALVAAWLLAEVLSLAFAKIAENSGRVRRYIEEIKVRAALIPRLKKRREHLLKIVEQRNDEASTLGNRRNGLTGRLRKIRGTSAPTQRELGYLHFQYQIATSQIMWPRTRNTRCLTTPGRAGKLLMCGPSP